MDKNTIIGIILMVALVFGFSYYNQQSAEEAAAQQAQNEAVAKAETTTPQAASQTVANKVTVDSTSLFAMHHINLDTLGRAAKPVVLKNEKVSVEISPVGGMPSRVCLNEYKSYKSFVGKKSDPLVLFDASTSTMNFSLDTKTKNIQTKDYCFVPTQQTDNKVTMLLQDADGKSIEFQYELLPDNYMVNLTIKTQGLADLCSSNCNSLNFKWNDRVRQQEKGHTFENRYATLTYKLTDDDTENLSETSDESEEAEADVDWVAFKNQYFSAVVIGAKPLSNAKFDSKMEKDGSGFLKNYTCTTDVKFSPSDSESTQLQFYFGPNNYRLLASMDQYSISKNELDLEDIVYLGWPLVRWINRFFTLYVFDFLTKMGLPMGIVLILITLLLRVIVYSPTKKSFMSSAKMRVLRPKMDEITKKYPNQEDAMKRQQEMMTLQSQYGVNPMGGCLPMLIQMPIWIAMFNFVPNAIELRQQSLLWAEDLSTYDSLLSWETPIWGIGDHLSIFCLLFCATNIVYSYLNMRQQRDTMAMAPEQASQMKIMQWFMYLMPVMFFFMFNDYSAGLNFYYFISLLFSAMTMWYLRWSTDDAKLLAQLEENYRKNKQDPNKKPTGLAARLAALQEQQQKMLEEKQKYQYKK